MSFFDLVNLWGLLFAVILCVPHIIYVRTHTVTTADYSNRAMVYIARVGRFFSVFLMAFNIGVLEEGFPEPKALMERFWLIVTGVLLLVYLLLWLLFFKTEKKGVALAMILVSAIAVIFSGIVQIKTLLMTAGVIYLIGELYLFSQFFKKGSS